MKLGLTLILFLRPGKAADRNGVITEAEFSSEIEQGKSDELEKLIAYQNAGLA